MPTYSFQARDRSGTRVAGRVIEADLAQARARLEKTRPDLHEVVVRRDYAAVPGELANMVRPVPGTEVATFLRQLWLMFRAGVQLTRAIGILRDGYPNHRLREALYEVDRNLQEGHALSQAMGRFPGIFPGEICGLIKVGEATGQMEDVLDFAARLMEENDQRLRRVKSALTYPTFIMIVSVLMCGSLLLFFVPRMADVMRMIPGEMSTPVLVLLTLSSFLSNRVVVFTICLGTLLGLVGAWLWSQTARGKRWWDAFLLTFPITRPLIRHLSMARVAFGLHLMVGCGLNLTQSLTLITEGMPSYLVSEALERVRARVVEGEGLGVSMADEPLFGQAVLVQMVEVAEESSSLDTLMHRAYLFHRDQLESSLNTLTALVEPVIMAGMGLVVGGMVITFMLPLVRLVQTPLRALWLLMTLLVGSGPVLAQPSGSVRAPEPGRKMPSLVGQSARRARLKLEGFRVRFVEVQVDSGEGKILFQNPAPETPLTKDREIVLHLGVARQEVLLPDYQSEAKVPRRRPSKWTGPLCLFVLLVFTVGLVQMVRHWRPEGWGAVESPRVELDEKSG